LQLCESSSESYNNFPRVFPGGGTSGIAHCEKNGGDELGMNIRNLRILALLILAFSLSSYAQSLGDVARQLRAERRQSVPFHGKVITNDDIASSKPTPAKSAKETEATAADEGSKANSDSAGNAKHAKAEDSAKERGARELELQKRSEEINKVYRDRIAGLRSQIAAEQQELARLQRDQVESANQFQRSYGTAPNVGTYEAQQRLFSEQLEAHRTSISTLNAQLDDAQEAARHAGVPHATD
jgi:hypothetical protein